MIRLITFLLMVVSSLPACAANWYFFTQVQSSHEVYFFDQSSVVTHGKTVTIWYKSQRDEDYPNESGVVSVTVRARFDCHGRTIRRLSAISYNKSGNVLFSDSAPGAVEEIIPGTIAEGIIVAVCSRNFPRQKSPLYSPVGADIDAAAKNYFAETKDAAPTDPSWLRLFSAVSSSPQTFVDVRSVKKDEDGVLAWVLMVYDPDGPGENGVYSFGGWYRYSCARETLKVLRSSFYDKEHKFMVTIPGNDNEMAVNASSAASVIRSIVCSSDFPKLGGTDEYAPLKNNDPYAPLLFKSGKANPVAPQ